MTLPYAILGTDRKFGKLEGHKREVIQYKYINTYRKKKKKVTQTVRMCLSLNVLKHERRRETFPVLYCPKTGGNKPTY